MAAAVALPANVPDSDLCRIRQAVSRLTDVDDVKELRRLAESEASRAEAAGDETRACFCNAVVDEATAAIDARGCFVQVANETRHPHPLRFQR
jgi:hypothetical protein